MDKLLNLLGGSKPVYSPIPAADDSDFADFASAPSPSPVDAVPSSAAEYISQSASPTPGAFVPIQLRPYTKWYRVWERTSIQDFYSELFILPFILLIIGAHVWGMKTNRRKAKSWITAHAPVLEQEFALTGFKRTSTSAPDEILKEKALNEYIAYASGRQNVAFLDIKLTLARRFNPAARLGEEAVGFIWESMPAPRERMEAISYVFDGRENDFVPMAGGKAGPEAQELKRHNDKSAFDGFVFAIVHKDAMKQLRDARYDLSLTTTKDHQKLPIWATTMSESAEITDTLLTPELIKAVEQAGEPIFESLIISDQPLEKPSKLSEIAPKKRISLSLRVPSSNAYENSLPLFQLFIRLADVLATKAHFRPEALRRVKATREDEVRKLKRLDQDEKAEERRLKGDKEKKERRDALLKSLTADEQRKFLEKERASDMRKSQKRRTQKG